MRKYLCEIPIWKWVKMWQYFIYVITMHIQSNLHKRDTFWKVKTVCYTQVSVLSRFNQNFIMKKSFTHLRFKIKLQYKEDHGVFFDIFYMILCFITQDKENYSWALKLFHRFVHTSLDSIVTLSVNWSSNSLFVEFWPKNDLGQVWCGCLIESNKHFGNNSTGWWLGYGGGCLM